jgi:hypothetical protein
MGAPPVDGQTDADQQVTETLARDATGGRRRRRQWAIVAVVAVLAVTGATVAVLATGADPPTSAEPPLEPPAGAGADPEAAAAARQAFAAASRTLTTSGTWAYRGTVRSDGSAAQRPHWLGPEVQITGQVALPTRATESATGNAGVSETVISGHGLWARTAATASDLLSRPWAFAAEGEFGLGLASLPEWLSRSTDRTTGPPDDQGRRRYTAAVDVAGLIAAGLTDDPTARGRITLTIDDAGTPVHVELTASDNGPRLAVDLDSLGAPVAITPPDGIERSITPSLTVADLAAAGITDPVELTQMPTGWVLHDVQLDRMLTDPACSVLTLFYVDVTDPENKALSLDVTPTGCDPAVGTEADREHFVDDWYLVVDATGASKMTNGTTDVTYWSEGYEISEDTLRAMSMALGPYEPGRQLTAGSG